MNNYYVYEWIRLDLNEPFYVGKGKENRCYETKRNKHFNDVLSYCSSKDIGVAISLLENGLTEEEAYEIECFYIHEYELNWGFKLTNKTWGGEGGDIVSMMSPERKKEYSIKMSESLKGKNIGPRSEAVKQKISETKIMLGNSRGKSNPMYGKSVKDYMTEEAYKRWRENISFSLTGKKHTNETILKMREAALGRVLSETTRSKLREINLGVNNPMFGKLHSLESKNLIGKSHEKKIEAILCDGSRLSFESRNKCADYFKDNYNIGIYTIKKLLRTREKLSSKYKKFDDLNGLSIYYIE